MSEVRNKLRAAMKARQLQGLIDSIQFHDNEADFTVVPEYDQTVQLRDLVKEELRISAVVKDVLAELGGNKDPPQNVLDKLTAVVQAAKKINFHTGDVDHATELFEEITSRIQTRKELKEGVANSDEVLLQKAVAEAKRLGFSDGDPLLSDGRAELARIEQEKEILKSMRVALSLPPSGPADLTYTNPHINQLIQISPEGEVVLYEGAWEELEECVTQAHNFGIKTAEGKKLLESSTLVLHLRSAIGQDDWDQVEKLLLDNKLGDSPNLIKTVEMRAAHDQLILKAKKAEVQEALEAAAAAFDPNALQLAVDKGFALRMEVDSYQQLVDAIVATQQALYDGLQAIEEEALTYAIGLADQIYYNLEDYHQAVELRDTLKSLSEEIDFNLNLMPDREALDELFNRAKNVGMHTAPYDELGGYLQLDEEGLAKIQLKSALRRNDKERVIQLNIRLKEIFFKLFGNSFVFSACSKIKTPSEYTKGVIFKKEKVRDNMMKWSKHPVHASLTRTNPLYAKEAVLISKNMLGWMGEKAMSFPNMLAREILEKGIQIPDVRDEIFVQIIKQTTDNPNPQSTEKGWKLMNMCLHCFPPSREFENYLEIYFRNKDPSNANVYRKQLHQIVWSGPVSVPPSPEQIASEF